MKFGEMPLADAVGTILAHSTRHGGGTFKKGRKLSADDIAALEAAGLTSVVAARLAEDDVPEDEAAGLVSHAAAGSGTTVQEPFTGRANLHSGASGLLVVDEERLQAVNQVHESLTIATLPNYSRVAPRQMLATVKIIPFAVPREVLQKALTIVGRAPLMKVVPFLPRRAGLVITQLPQTKAAIIAKSEAAIATRLAELGAGLAQTIVVPHAEGEVARAIAKLQTMDCDPILVFGASAIVDRGDVIPAAVVAAGGEVIHFGMPVDPGNLLMLGRLGETPVLGVPSCARSPKVNGFDWVLERVIAGLPVSGPDLMAMGAGGLLAEIPSRPSPREGKGGIVLAPRVVAVVLAAGLSSRMGSQKLLADFRGQPLIRATVGQIRKSGVDEIIVVLGHESGKVQEALAGLNVRFIDNPDHALGLSTSVACGVAAAAHAAAVVVCLGDMPLVQPRTINKLAAAFNPTEHRSIIVPTYNSQFGNPVLWGAEHFPRLLTLSGDKGARGLLPNLKAEAVEIEVDDAGILADADTPEALARLRSAPAP